MKVDLNKIKEKGLAKLISRIKDDDSYEIDGEDIRPVSYTHLTLPTN